MMFGFGDQGTTNLITKCLEAVGKKLETIPDPTQVHYHLPKSNVFPEVRLPAGGRYHWAVFKARHRTTGGSCQGVHFESIHHALIPACQGMYLNPIIML